MFQKAQTESAPEEGIEGAEQLNLFDDAEGAENTALPESVEPTDALTSDSPAEQTVEASAETEAEEQNPDEHFDIGPSADDDIQLDDNSESFEEDIVSPINEDDRDVSDEEVPELPFPDVE